MLNVFVTIFLSIGMSIGMFVIYLIIGGIILAITKKETLSAMIGGALTVCFAIKTAIDDTCGPTVLTAVITALFVIVLVIGGIAEKKEENKKSNSIITEDDLNKGNSSGNVSAKESSFFKKTIGTFYSGIVEKATVLTGKIKKSDIGTNKKSPILYVLAVLLIGALIIGGLVIFKHKNNKSSDNSSNNAVIASTSDAETTTETQSSSSEAATTVEKTTEAATTTSSETTTAETTTEVPTETASPENGLKAFPASDINNYPQYIQTIKDGINSGYYTESSASYGLYDLNADGIPELIINTAPYGIYAMDGNNCVELQSSFTATRSPSLSLMDKGFIKTTFVIPPGEAAVSYWKYFGGSQLAMQDDGGDVSHFGNDITLELTPVSGIAGITDYSGSQASSKITPVEKYGTIYSPAGYKVEGYDRSYIIDGGPIAYVRQDLTDGWHIKAVNRYSTDAAEWYELYDADDGDYYGWVSNHHISFY
ncbi:MAG: hypothetical protein IJM55_04985 [Ruminococcus sp.]|nr:hypothetical protein [Ruminococcus sp.]